MPIPDHEIVCSSSKSPKDFVRSQCIAGLFLLLCVCAAPSSAAGQSYLFRSFDEPNATSPGSGIPPRTFAYGVNDSGTVVGSYTCCTSGLHAFQRSGNTYTIVDYPSSSCGFSHCGDEVRGINNSGEVVGDYIDASGNSAGYIYANGSYSLLLIPGSTYMQPNAVNNQGVVVGYYADANSVGHGFTFNGAFTTFDGCPAGSTMPYLSGVNDVGDMVGYCFTSSMPQEPLGFKFTAASGQFTTISFPGALATRALGINNSGQIVGLYNDSSGHFHGFLLSQGNYITVDPPGSTLTEVWAINNHGQIVGDYADAVGAYHGFVASSAQLVDPVDSDPSNSLLNGPAITTDAKLLGTQGRPVQGVTADGVTEVVVVVPALNVGDQFMLILLNDSGTQINPNEDGALGNPGDTSFSQSQLTITAGATSGNSSNPVPAAFAVYRAPVDFARQVSAGLYKSGSCGGQPVSDDQSGCRSVTIQIQNVTTGSTASVQVRIVRPPIILVHGLWGDPHNWDNFSPLFSNLGTPMPDPTFSVPRFYVGLVDYSAPPNDVVIVSSTPDYSSLPAMQGMGVLNHAGANSLGFQYNARGVMSKIATQIRKFKGGANPAGVSVAGVQADLVGHSMGGDISRTIALQFDFLSKETFGQGSIHKLITIDTPHLGSPLATQLLQSQNSCVANLLALGQKPAFSSVQVAFGQATLTLPGAVGDLSDSPSQALQNIAAPGQHPLPTALIAGTVNSTNLGGLATSGTATFLRTTCGTAASNPLASNLTAAGWPTVFNNQPNDAIVDLNSQLNGLSTNSGFIFDGNVHSPGTEGLGFAGPSVLDSGLVPTQVILLLNTPVSNAVFHPLNP